MNALDPDVPSLLRRLLGQDSGRPRVTWYGPDAERVELSARVLDNWVAKSANLLADELDAGPGSRIGVDLPGHWRTAAWLLAIWSVGACVVLPRSIQPDQPVQPGLQALLSTDPAGAAGRWSAEPTGQLVGVALPALALSFGPGLPAGALDAAVEVRTHGDVFLPLVRPVPADPALRLPDGATLSHGELLEAARLAAERSGWAPGARVLASGEPADAVRWLLAPFTLGGSVVLHAPPHPAGPDLDRIAAQEGVTDRIG